MIAEMNRSPRTSSQLQKRANQLGMPQGTAAHRLRVDIMFSLVIRLGYKCHRCGCELTRADFSIDHKIEWQDSDNPAGLFFDLNNVAFSPHSCN